MSKIDKNSARWLAPAKQKIELADFPTRIADETASADELKDQLRRVVKKIAKRQSKLYADNRHALLFVFQAMDAAGKDSTIRSVFSGVNPAGFQVHAFKKPSKKALDHDFLWRSATALPERGRIGIFNRSYYEEVLVVRVHPEILAGQQLPAALSDHDALWDERLQSIADHELHLARNGTRVVKFFLNVSLQEQARRFISRIDEAKKNWKFNAQDVQERQHWGQYQYAYGQAISRTSTASAPWYVVPADDKLRMRLEVAKIVLHHLQDLSLQWPSVDEQDRAALQTYRLGLSDGSL